MCDEPKESLLIIALGDAVPGDAARPRTLESSRALSQADSARVIQTAVALGVLGKTSVDSYVDAVRKTVRSAKPVDWSGVDALEKAALVVYEPTEATSWTTRSLIEVAFGSAIIKVHDLSSSDCAAAELAAYGSSGVALGYCVLAAVRHSDTTTSGALTFASVTRMPASILTRGISALPASVAFGAVAQNTNVLVLASDKRFADPASGAALVKQVAEAARRCSFEVHGSVPLVRCLYQASIALELESVVRGVEVDAWARMAMASIDFLGALERAGFIRRDTAAGPSWTLPAGCAVVLFSWGPHAAWISREAGKHARRLLAAGTRRPTRSYSAAFCGEDTASGRLHSEASRIRQVQSCVDRAGLRVSDHECHRAADLMGLAHMPDNAVDIVEQRFILPLVASVEFADSRQRQLDILRTDAPFSGAAEYVESLSDAALAHQDVAYWVHHFLVSQCAGEIPLSLDGLHVGGDAKMIDGALPVSAISNADVADEASGCALSAGSLLTAVTSLLGPLPDGYVALFHGTTAGSLESVMTNPSWDSSTHLQDFGNGLYVTTQPRQALAWAWMKQGSSDNPAAVVTWHVSRALFEGLMRHRYEFGDDFQRTVWSWHVLCNSALRHFRKEWPYREFDTVSGPVALKPREVQWKDVEPSELTQLDCNEPGSPDGHLYGDQFVLRTETSIDVLCDERSSVCGVVLMSPSIVLRSSVPHPAAGGASAASSGGT